MKMRDDFAAYGKGAVGREDWDFMVSAGFFGESDQAFRRLEALGDDLSLADAQLLDLADLLSA